MPDIARAHPNECSSCRGRGQTHNNATLMVPAKPGSTKLKTVQQGCGCGRCLGIGRLSQETPK